MNESGIADYTTLSNDADEIVHCTYICALLGSRLKCLIVSLLLSHWYSWPVVVRDCIDY